MDSIILIIGIVVTIISIGGYFFKKKEYILLSFLIYDILMIVQFYLTNHLTEILISTITIFKNIVYFIYIKKEWKPSIWVLLAFESLLVAVSVASWENWYSIFILLSMMTTTYVAWQDNLLILRIGSCVASLLLIANYIFVGLYTTIIGEAFVFFAVLLTIFMYHTNLFKSKKVSTCQSVEEKQFDNLGGGVDTKIE